MAIQTKKKYSGQQTTEVLDGNVRIENGNNRLMMHDGEVNRLLIGKAPNGEYIIAISAVGVDVVEALGS